jgi:hypothetical protein
MAKWTANNAELIKNIPNMKSGKFTSLELVTGAVKTVGLFCEL